jgi:hypothetical protein
LVILLVVFVMGLSVYNEVQTVRLLHRGGQVYASWRWRESEAIAFLRELPSDVIIHTNQPGVVYLYTGRPSTIFPEEPAIEAVRQNVLAGKAVLAFFRDYKAGVDTLKNYQILSAGLYGHHFSGDVVYTAPPP